MTTARNRAINHLRRDSRYWEKLAVLATILDTAIREPDDRLGLIFTCCHLRVGTRRASGTDSQGSSGANHCRDRPSLHSSRVHFGQAADPDKAIDRQDRNPLPGTRTR